ncbi:unnamed protein product [Fraxinus pennsylvanica]|uniref:Nucleoside phosphorylase domain-containing protein n=1 Tax=Fraxinus pennsylvanica TaxID=56036 RepID=A0AAD2E899_9LAMI|nr:unnamed protein product [Fraxinus pennsylvanica]
MSIVVRILSLGWVMMMIMSITNVADADISSNLLENIAEINEEGPYLGIVVPKTFELDPLLRSSNFLPHATIPQLDYAGRRFRVGTLENRKVIAVVSGNSMLNSGLATQLLLSLFKIEGVLHFGVAGNVNPQIKIGDVTIPQYWAHTGLWNWQRYGDRPGDALAFESTGDYTRNYGYLNFAKYKVGRLNGKVSDVWYPDNYLNNVWYQPEEIYSIDGEPENRQHIFWVPVNKHYYRLARKLEDIVLEQCANSATCLPQTPKVVTVRRGVSANVLVDNAAYRDFLYSKFKAAPVDMESAAVALVCHQQKTPFIVIRAISDLANGTSFIESSNFSSLAVQNAVKVAVKFITLSLNEMLTLDAAQ